MRRQKKTILWPVYFDSSKTRKKGRKVSRSNGVPNPKLEELRSAAERLGLKPQGEVKAAHPAIPRSNTGRVCVTQSGTKMQILTEIADEIATFRQRTRK